MPKKLNITLVTSMANSGGTEIATHRIALLLKKQKQDVQLFSSKGPLVQDLIDNDVEHFEIDFYSKNPIKIISTCLKTIKLLKENPTDIIHCQMARPIPLMWLASLFIKYPVRIFWHSRGLPAKTYPLVSGLFSKLSVNAIANCQHEQEKLIRHGYDKKLVSYTYNPLPENRDTVKNSSKKDKANIVLGTISRLEKERSIDKAIIIFSKLYEENKNIKLIIAGDGSQLGALKKMVEEHGLNDQITFLGRVQDITQFYNQVDIVLNTICLTGDDGAGVGNNTIEAGIYSKTFITFDSCGIKELVVNNVTGFCIEANNIDEFTEKTQLLISDDKLRKKFSKSLNSHVLEQCSDKKIYEDLVEAYTKS